MTCLPLSFSQTTDYHWSSANQRCFLEALSISGNITESAASVSMTKQAAHAFRNRAAGAVFKLGWDAAILLARARLEADLLERAIEGQEEIYERDSETGRVRRIRSDNRLSMSVLHRLDKMTSSKNDVPADTYLARVVAQDFEAFLDLIERDGGRAEAMLFLKVRDDGLVPMINVTREELSNNSQLSQNSANFEESSETGVEPEEAAAQMSVWYCEYSDGWRTNFPPPPDFYGDEEGQFGCDNYERQLSDDEILIQEAMLNALNAPLRDAAIRAREAWFSQAGADEAKAQIADEAAQTAKARKQRLCERAAETAERVIEPASKAALPLEKQQMEIEADAEEISPELAGPNVRTIICKSQPNYAATGKPPPWAQRVY